MIEQARVSTPSPPKNRQVVFPLAKGTWIFLHPRWLLPCLPSFPSGISSSAMRSSSILVAPEAWGREGRGLFCQRPSPGEPGPSQGVGRLSSRHLFNALLSPVFAFHKGRAGTALASMVESQAG